MKGTGIEALEAKHEALSDRVDRLDKEIRHRLAKIDDKLDSALNRPSWFTVWIITFLASGFITMLGIFLKGM